MRRPMLSGIVIFVVSISPSIFTSDTLASPPSHRQCFLAGSRCEVWCAGSSDSGWAQYCSAKCRGQEDACHNAVKYSKDYEFKQCGGVGGLGRRDCLKPNPPCIERTGSVKNCIGKDPDGRPKDGKSGQEVTVDPVRPPKPPVGAQPPAKNPQSTGTWTPPSQTPPPPVSPVKDPAPKTPPARELLTKPFGGTYRP